MLHAADSPIAKEILDSISGLLSTSTPLIGMYWWNEFMNVISEERTRNFDVLAIYQLYIVSTCKQQIDFR